jgi:hypothetical protein
VVYEGSWLEVFVADEGVTIRLTGDEALVLSHWLERLEMTD